MTATLVLRGVYDASGAGQVIVGQPAVCLLQLTMPNPAGFGPDVPQSLDGRAFVQRLIAGDGTVVAAAAGQVLDQGQIRFTLDAVTILGLLPAGAGAVDLQHALVELLSGGDDLVMIRPFAVRTPNAGAQTAIFTLDTDSAGPTPLIVRYAGAPAAPPWTPIAFSAAGLLQDGEELGPLSWPAPITFDPLLCSASSRAGPVLPQTYTAWNWGTPFANVSFPAGQRVGQVVLLDAVQPGQAQYYVTCPNPADITQAGLAITFGGR
ncbi:MAG: hypothetical protein ACR2F8_03035 [Caulobacteraceae bacterium]